MNPKLLAAVLTLLGIEAFSEEAGKKTLSEDQFKTIEGVLGKENAEKFKSDLAAMKAEEDAPENTDPTASLLETTQALLVSATVELNALKNDKTTNATKITELEGKITKLDETIVKLGDAGEQLGGKTIIPQNQDEQMDHTIALFGNVNIPWMKLEGRPWNQRAAHSLGAEVVASSSIDYSQLESDLGAYYRTRKQDSIISFVRKLPSNERLFPLESGYQDESVLVNAFLGEFSQAFQDTFTAKGSYELQPEKLKMYDVKFDHKFTKLKELEKQWIGYLNREGADAMKWSFIEYIIGETMKKLHNEREMRRIRGVYKVPTSGVAGKAINAANGLLTFVKQKITGLQIKPFVMGEWTTSNLVDYVFEMAMQIPQDIRDTGELVAIMSADAQIYYDKNFESKYGQNSDYSGPDAKVKFIKSIKTEAANNMGSSKRIIITIAGNIRFFEDLPNEMYKLNFEQEDRTLKVWSDWREGVHAIMVGKKWATADEMDYEHQMIWCNEVDEPADYFIDVDADDTTPSVSVHTSLKTATNTGATAITDIDDLAVGQTCILKCGSNDANNSTIAKAGNFANLTAAWTPDLGDTVTLFKRAAGDIVDLARTTASTDAIEIADGDATPDVSGGTKFITQANTGATEITDLDNPTVGETYTIYGGSATNASTITNAANFDLTDDMTLGVGTWIKLYCRADNDYLELAREE